MLDADVLCGEESTGSVIGYWHFRGDGCDNDVVVCKGRLDGRVALCAVYVLDMFCVLFELFDCQAEPPGGGGQGGIIIATRSYVGCT